MFDHLKPDFINEAVKAGEKEMCGLVVDDQFVRCNNVSKTPEESFKISAQMLAKYPNYQAVVHSHPKGPCCPSKHDMKAQQASGRPWIIVAFNQETGAWEVFDFGDHRLKDPLLERSFRHGVHDCYGLIRSWWYQEKGVKLPEYPRDDEWWGNPQEEIEPQENMYLDGFEYAGFERFYPSGPEKVRAGDVALIKLGADVYNHGGVVAGNGLFMHHALGHLSKTDIVGRWFRHIDFWLRRPDDV